MTETERERQTEQEYHSNGRYLADMESLQVREICPGLGVSLEKEVCSFWKVHVRVCVTSSGEHI